MLFAPAHDICELQGIELMIRRKDEGEDSTSEKIIGRPSTAASTERERLHVEATKSGPARLQVCGEPHFWSAHLLYHVTLSGRGRRVNHKHFGFDVGRICLRLDIK